MSLGYGDINTLETLPDTYYGGLNMVTGLTSDKLRAMDNDSAKQTIQSAMNTSAFGLNAQVIDSTKKYRDSFYETMTTDTTTTTSITSNTTYASLNTVWSETNLAMGNYVSPYIQFSNGSQMSIPFSDTIGNFINDYNSNHDPETDFLSYDENTGIMTHFYYGESSTSPPIITNSVPVITTTTETIERPMTEDEKEAAKESALQKLNEDLNYALGKWDNAMISVSNTFRRIGVATGTLEEVDNQLQTAQDTYIKEYNDHMAIDAYDAIVQMYQHQYAYNAAMQVGSKIMQNSLFDFVQ